MSIVTVLPDVSAQSRAFISGRSKVQGMVTFIHKWGGRGWREKVWVRIQVAVCVFTKHARFGVKQLG